MQPVACASKFVDPLRDLQGAYLVALRVEPHHVTPLDGATALGAVASAWAWKRGRARGVAQNQGDAHLRGANQDGAQGLRDATGTS
jgi:hypothetical protein